MIINVTRVDKDCCRVEVDDRIVGFALRMANSTWAAFDPDMNKRVSPAAFKTPKSAANALIPTST